MHETQLQDSLRDAGNSITAPPIPCTLSFAICYMLNSCRLAAAYDCYERNTSLLVGERFNSIAAAAAAAAVGSGNNSTLVPRLGSTA